MISDRLLNWLVQIAISSMLYAWILVPQSSIWMIPLTGTHMHATIFNSLKQLCASLNVKASSIPQQNEKCLWYLYQVGNTPTIYGYFRHWSFLQWYLKLSFLSVLTCTWPEEEHICLSACLKYFSFFRCFVWTFVLCGSYLIIWVTV